MVTCSVATGRSIGVLRSATAAPRISDSVGGRKADDAVPRLGRGSVTRWWALRESQLSLPAKSVSGTATTCRRLPLAGRDVRSSVQVTASVPQCFVVMRGNS